MLTTRYLQPAITADLRQRMVFLAGARQVGKTTLARQILEEAGGGVYLSWDNRADRREIRQARWPADRGLVVLDELHKWRGWKRWIKGEYDQHHERLGFLVTGSARLDVYRRGGDSLQGRYHHYRLHPFSLAEAAGSKALSKLVPGEELDIPRRSDQPTLEALMTFGGFPEPFLERSARTLRRWQKERLDRFFREDVRDLENLRDLSSLELLADSLPERVGSPLSLNSLREDLEVSHRALSHWMDVLERLYYAFRLRPYVSPKIRALKKMPKTYLWDSSLVTAEGARFENLVALHLLKTCHYLEDVEGHRVELWYLRDRAGREIDFLVTSRGRPWFAVEAKLAAGRPERHLVDLRDQLGIPWVYQVSREAGRDVMDQGIRCLGADRFFGALV